jgi:hypothetical protein
MTFPPIPNWKPHFQPGLDVIMSTFLYYTSGSKDFVILRHGTIVLLEDNLERGKIEEYVKEVISAIFNFHPDMNPKTMDDGNILVSYNHPAFNIAFEELAVEYWADIERNHQEALCVDEVLMTPLGSNVFDDFGKKALWARCYFFMDAPAPEIVRVVNHAA